MNLSIILIDTLGILCFSLAAYFSYRNNHFVQDASNLWLYFGTASIMAICWIASLIMQQFISIPDIIESSLFFAVIFLFSLVAVASLFDFIKLQAS